MNKDMKKNMNKKLLNDKPLRALLLSAGLGSRLRPLTDNKPKCLMEIDNQPIMEYWLSKLEKVGCEKALINTHYLFEEVDQFLNNRKKSSMFVQTKYEKKLLGTAGTLIHNCDFFNNSKIIMIHVDNMTNFDIKTIIDFHDESKADNCLFTMLTFKTDNPSNCGVVVTDKQMILREFYEKIDNPPTNVANGAIYIFEYDFLEKLKKEMPNVTDFSKEVIPNYIGKIRTYFTDELFIDIGNPESLALARSKFIRNYK